MVGEWSEREGQGGVLLGGTHGMGESDRQSSLGRLVVLTSLKALMVQEYSRWLTTIYELCTSRC